MATYGPAKPYSAFRTANLTWWPIGTSITQGVRGGYRRTVFTAMTAAGKSPSTVGGLLTASYGGDPALCGTYHNGNAGSTVANWIGSYYATYVGSAGTPNLVTIELGANDADTLANGDKVGGDMVDLAAASFPKANILVFNCLDRYGAQLTNLNSGIASAVATRKARGVNVDVVDMRSCGATLIDGLHPSDDGYVRMGERLVANISRYL
jgi:lysophospholipase L1-like esterase